MTAPQSPSSGERCLTCGRTDGEYAGTEWTCVDPWHGDDHLRKKAALQSSSSGSAVVTALHKSAASGFLCWPMNAIDLAKKDLDLPKLIDKLAQFIADWEQKGINSAAQAPTGWQPIETAPKDGTIVDLWWSHNDGREKSYRRTDCSWAEHRGGWFWPGIRGGTTPKNWTATHWMERPDSPSVPSTHCQPEEISSAEMDAIEEAAIAGKPLSSTHGATDAKR